MSASEGPATDQKNDPVIDPTENVKALSSAANDRQDDLRTLESEHLREILALRTEHVREIRAADAALNNERFDGVRREQALTESHRIELKADSATQLTAALAAAEKAVQEQNKSATLSVDRAVAGMKELILNNQQVNQATTNALGDKVEDLKTNVAMLVNTRVGAQETRTEQRAVTGGMLALISVGLTVVTIAISLVLNLALR